MWNSWGLACAENVKKRAFSPQIPALRSAIAAAYPRRGNAIATATWLWSYCPVTCRARFRGMFGSFSPHGSCDWAARSCACVPRGLHSYCTHHTNSSNELFVNFSSSQGLRGLCAFCMSLGMGYLPSFFTGMSAANSQMHLGLSDVKYWRP